MKEIHIKEIQGKLRAWVALQRQCASMEPLLHLAKTLPGHAEEGGVPDPRVMEAAYQALRTKAAAALEEASEALRTSQRG
jgi:hypothetical protein